MDPSDLHENHIEGPETTRNNIGIVNWCMEDVIHGDHFISFNSSRAALKG